jgi:parvulin-like peptidyl-prolyl isomerase
MRGEAFRRAMTARVDQTLLIQAAHRESLEPDQLEVSRRVDAFITQRVDEAGGRAEFIQTLRGSQLNLESFRSLLISRESQRQLASGIVSRRVTISSAELEAFKKQRSEAGEPVEQVQLAQILVRCPSSEQGTEFGDEQFRRALEIASRAGRQPAAFSKIIADINADPTGRERGGLLGWIDPSTLQPSISAAVAGMRRGEVSEPIASDAGYHVLFVVERRDARDILYARKFEQERNKLIEELRGKAQIEIYTVEGAG